MSQIALKIKNLGKQYFIGHAPTEYHTLRDVIMQGISQPLQRLKGLLRGESYAAANLNQSMWALQDVSFTVQRGEVLGVIGHNGAGKSTLLKILSRITEPTTGEITLYGRVGALLEVGTGFHQELTGRENILLNGAILGMSRRDVLRKFDAIVDFAGVEAFLDTPVKHYSTGMRLRLGFAVAAFLEPDILIVDEVLAVGDAAFRQKCLGKMSEVAQSGRTVLIVSHNMAAIEHLCQRAILLEHGRLVYDDITSKTIYHYLNHMQQATQSVSLRERTNRTGNGKLRFVGYRLLNENDQAVQIATSGQTLKICLDYQSVDVDQSSNVRAGLQCFDASGRIIFSQMMLLYHEGFRAIPEQGYFVCEIPRLPLPAGRYHFMINAKVDDVFADYLNPAFSIDVVDGDFFNTGKSLNAQESPVLVDAHWGLLNHTD